MMFAHGGRGARHLSARHLRFRHLAPAGAAVIALLAAACGSSSGSGASPATSAPAKLTGTPYVIGNIGTYSGSYASSNIGSHDAMLAWVQYTNAHGGINGHPVKMVQFDDQLNAGLALTDVKQMVEQDHVMAIVGTGSVSAEDAWAPYIAASTTAAIGDDLAGDEMTKYKNFFPEGTGVTSGYDYSLPRIAALQGKTKYGVIYCAESVACATIATGQKAQAQRAGVSFEFSASAAAAATSYTSQCLAAKSAGVTALAMMLNSQVAGEVAAACAQQGFTPLYLQASNGFSMQETSMSSLDGVSGPTPDFPWFSSANPAMKAFQDAMHTYEPQDFSSSTAYGYSEAAAMAWASAEIFKAAALTLKPGHATSADLLAALYKLPKGDTFGGLTPPITYSNAGGVQPQVNCFFEIQLKSGTYKALNGAKPVCPS